jgi:hypothetical protein
MQRAYGFAEQGAMVVVTNGVFSTTLAQGSWPFARITVYSTGTTSLASIFSDSLTTPTPQANPFTANEFGWWWFYAPNGRYDVTITPIGMAGCAWTIGDILLYDAGEDPNANLIAGPGIIISQTPSPPKPATSVISTDPVWPGDNNANGFNLFNLNSLQIGSGTCSITLMMDANCSLGFYDPSGTEIANLSQAGDLTIRDLFARNGTFTGDLNVAGTTTLGDTNITGSITINGQPFGPSTSITTQLVQTNCIQFTNPATPLTMWICLTPNGNLAVSNDTTDFIWITQTGQIGMGDSQPQVGLQISSGELRVSGASSPTSGFGVEIWCDLANNNSGIENYDYDAAVYRSFNIEASPLLINVATNNAGVVGIKTDAPNSAYALDVGGSIHAAGCVFIGTEPVSLCTDGSGNLTLNAGSVNIPNLLYVQGVVIDGVPVPPPPDPTASWAVYTPTLLDANHNPIPYTLSTGRYSIWSTWLLVLVAIQFNPQGQNISQFFVGIPPGITVVANYGSVPFAGYFNNAPGLTVGFAGVNLAQEIEVDTVGSTPSLFMQVSMQGILEIAV